MARAQAGYAPVDTHWPGCSGEARAVANVNFCPSADGSALRGQLAYCYSRGRPRLAADAGGRGSGNVTGLAEAAEADPCARNSSTDCCVRGVEAHGRGDATRGGLRAGEHGGNGSLPAHLAIPAEIGLPRSETWNWRNGTQAWRCSQLAQRSSTPTQGLPAWARNRDASCYARYDPHAGASVDAVGHNESEEGALRVWWRRNPGDDAAVRDSPFHSPDAPTPHLASASRPAIAVWTGPAPLSPEVASPQMKVRDDGWGKSRGDEERDWVQGGKGLRNNNNDGPRRSGQTRGTHNLGEEHAKRTRGGHREGGQGGNGRRGSRDSHSGGEKGHSESPMRITTAEMTLLRPTLHRAAAADVDVSALPPETRDPPDDDAPSRAGPPPLRS